MSETKTDYTTDAPSAELTDLVDGFREIVCLRCGRVQQLGFPLQMPDLVQAVKLFHVLHQFCGRHPDVAPVIN